MYLDKETVDVFFKNLPMRGVKATIVFEEGTWKDDVYRTDNTTMYNFKKRLQMAGYKQSTFIEKWRENDIYKYFIMC